MMCYKHQNCKYWMKFHGDDIKFACFKGTIYHQNNHVIHNDIMQVILRYWKIFSIILIHCPTLEEI